jgi:hypothetical protein
MDIADICSRLEVLTEVVRGIEVGLGRLSYGDPMFPLAERPPAPSPNPRSRYVPTDWPRIGGRVELPDMSHLFAGAAYCDQYQPGDSREIYAAACSGLAQLVARIRMPLYKVSSCALGRIANRMEELGRDRYASEWFRNGEYVSEPDGFNKWFPSHLSLAKPAAPNSPVVIGARALTVKLPRTLSAEAFDLEFDAEIRKAAIDLWAMTEAGARHFAFVDVDPAMAQRATSFPYGSGIRSCPAKEIAVFRPNEDAYRLVNIVERVILKHLALIP